jgi:hypothetical protein
MPISFNEFNAGRTRETYEAQVLEFLGAHTGEAFLPEEVYELRPFASETARVMGRDYETAWNHEESMRQFIIPWVLEKLAEEGSVLSKEVDLPDGRRIYYSRNHAISPGLAKSPNRL